MQLKKSGFKSNTERTQGSYSKYSSIDDKLDTLHYYTTLISLVLEGQLMMHHKKSELTKLLERKE